MRIDSLWCSFVPDSDVVPPQVAFAIGRATGSAVRRNRLRRRLREILRASDLPPGLWLIGATGPADEHTFAELQPRVRELLESTMQRSAQRSASQVTRR